MYSFIIGCARSGTSILGELIASHPDVHYLFEAHSIWELGGTGKNESHRLVTNHASEPVKKEIRAWFKSQEVEEKHLIEKNPRNVLRIPYVKEIFPNSKLLHIVRDGRDVSCSLVPGCGGERWAHLKPPSWKTFSKRYSGALRCAYTWKEVVEISLDDLRDVDHLQIRYEELILKPLAVSKRIFSYLGLSLNPSVVDFCEKISNDTNSTYHAKYQDRWYQPNHSRRIGRWHENLTFKEQEEINELLGPLLSQLGYFLGST